MAFVATEITLSDEERAALEAIVAAATSEQRMVRRARVVLLAADGLPNRRIAVAVGLSEQKVAQWRNRFAERRLEGLADLPRSGRPLVYGHDKRVEVFKTACSPAPDGETHWTVRSLAEEVGIGKSQTQAILAEADLKPHQVRSWLTSLDPDFDTKQADVCGLYLNPPDNAIVVSVDEKTSIQAKQPIRAEIPMQPGKPARREFEYKRHGVQALLAGLLVHTGEVIGNVYDRNSRVEFIDFLDRLDAQIPAGKHVHAILDNLQVHKTPEVEDWLTDHPRWTFHFTPTHASWLNQIELFFSILTRRLLRRGIFTSKTDLREQLLAFIDRYNPTAKPFAWTYEGKPLNT
ncbi:MAG: IS630 family transposase [Actinobacteria bacterium]|nr:IS630 family transposase [Actinomycetota bacterium]MCA1698455.1 IS630 family transposase [Actinomycetota bacterium]